MPRILDLIKYPFLNDGKHVIRDMNITYEKIDSKETYDELLTEAFNDIVASLSTSKPKFKDLTKFNTNFQSQVVKFYLSLMIVKPLTRVTKYYINYLIEKFQAEVKYDLKQRSKTLAFYLVMFKEFGIEWLTVRDSGVLFIKTPIDNYLDMAIHIDNNAPVEYRLLKFVNTGTHKGYVYFHSLEYDQFQLMLNVLLEARIKDLLNNITEVGNSKKIDVCRNNIKKYLLSNQGVKDGKMDQLYTDEINPAQQEEVMKSVVESKPVNWFPPCVNHILEKIDNKKVLNPAENILLASYLGKKGFVYEQINDIFKRTTNYKPDISKYNINYILDKKLKPFNCDKLVTEDLCYLQNDTTKQCGHIRNPMVYK